MNIVLPSLGDIDEVEVTEICVAVGDLVSAEDSVIVIESDKASMEVPAGHEGTVTELHVSVGDMLSEGAAIGVLSQTKTEAAAESPHNHCPALILPIRNPDNTPAMMLRPLRESANGADSGA